MQVKVKFFAILREKVGKSEVQSEIPEGSTIEDLWQTLRDQYPGISAVELKLLYAVNQDYVDRDYILGEGDEVVFVPPVSGGIRCTR